MKQCKYIGNEKMLFGNIYYYKIINAHIYKIYRNYDDELSITSYFEYEFNKLFMTTAKERKQKLLQIKFSGD